MWLAKRGDALTPPCSRSLPTEKVSSFTHLHSPRKKEGRFAVVVQLLSCVQLFCDPTDGSPPGSSVRGISQARIILEWDAISFSRGSS